MDSLLGTQPSRESTKVRTPEKNADREFQIRHADLAGKTRIHRGRIQNRERPFHQAP